jgi:hypothetical protein
MREELKKLVALFSKSPAIFAALTMLLGIYVLLLAATFGSDNGLLANMAQHDFARGVITYLFAVTTIGTAVVLVLSALTGEDNEQMEKRFQKGKEVLSLMLGVFGTIVGFYFGSDVRRPPQPETNVLQITRLHLSQTKLVSGEELTVTAVASGGAPPYKYGIVLGAGKEIAFEKNVKNNGRILERVVAPDVSVPTKIDVKLGVKDSTDKTVTVTSKIEVVAKARPTTPGQ